MLNESIRAFCNHCTITPHRFLLLFVGTLQNRGGFVCCQRKRHLQNRKRLVDYDPKDEKGDNHHENYKKHVANSRRNSLGTLVYSSGASWLLPIILKQRNHVGMSERLAEVAVHAGLQTLVDILLKSIGRNGDDGNGLRPRHA